jgi:hypothetical protein
MKNVDRFGQMTLAIFDQLLESFPIPTAIDQGAMLTAMGLTPSLTDNGDGFGPRVRNWRELDADVPLYRVYINTLDWLLDENFLRKDGDEFVLSSKALAALQSVPPAVGGQSLGSKVSSTAKDMAGEAGRSAVGELVGQVIGAAIRSMSS